MTLTDGQRYTLAGICAASAIGAFVAAMATCASGCGAAPSPADQLAVATYAAQQQLCVQRGGDKGQIDYCRDAIKSWACGDGGVLVEAGACGHVTLSDGRKP